MASLALVSMARDSEHKGAIAGSLAGLSLFLFLAAGPTRRHAASQSPNPPGPSEAFCPAFGAVGEQLSARVLDSLADGIIAADAHGQISFLNRAAEQLTGWTRASAIGQPLDTVFHVVDDDTGSRMTGLADHIAQACRIDHWFDKSHLLDQQGQPCPIAGSGSVIRDDQDNPVGVTITFRDRSMHQTERFFVSGRPTPSEPVSGSQPFEEASLKLAPEQDPCAKNRLYAAVIDSTREGVLITDLNARIIAVNPAYTEITGYREDEVTGLNPRFHQSGRHDPSFYQTMWSTLLETGHWQGEIWNRRKNGEIYPEWQTISTIHDDSGHPTHYVSFFTEISQRKESESRLERLAHYDPLTHLPNRLLVKSRLEHALERAQRRRSLVAVLFIDLDQFKTINDSLGHPAGDALLTDVAKRLASRLRREDTLGRLGGDEFLVVVEDLTNADDATIVAQNLLHALYQPFLLPNDQEVYVRASIGISVFPNDSANSAELIRNADAAMYQVKDTGRNAYGYYTRALTEAAAERLKLETRLRHALEREEFVLHYQPIVSVSDNRLIGAEALIRWQPKGDAMVPPSSFIGLAEETGLIVPLGEWILRQTCTQAKAWLDAGLSFGQMALNLSVRQFHHRNLQTLLADILGETGLPPECLELEITESCLMKRGEQAESSLRAIKSMGVGLSIDDFGTGYSSLAHLKSLPLDRLKIDCSFIRDIPGDCNEKAIASTVIAMAHHLGLRAIAEGVETPDQLEFLRQEGCDAYQGFLFSPPLPASEFAARFLHCHT
jgi:diguanylate cyclase (GGDEF)-like protein/PAS domain S-box-containing protein